MSRTLLQLVNSGLKEIGEPQITAFDTNNNLQNALIEDANNGVTEVRGMGRWRWSYKRGILVTSADITSGAVAATNGSTTVTSVTSAGVNADNFTGVTADYKIRIGNDLTTYSLASVDTASSPDTVTLETAYLGTTATAGSYILLQDTYDLSLTDLDEIIVMQYGEARPNTSLGATYGSTIVEQVSMENLLREAGGDPHRDTSGKPVKFSRISHDADENERIVLWPYPNTKYLLEFWYTQKYTSTSVITDVPFGTDSPEAAYQYVEYRVCRRACRWARDNDGIEYWEREMRKATADLRKRENRTYQDDNQMHIDVPRRQFSGGIRVESQRWFDQKPAVRW